MAGAEAPPANARRSDLGIRTLSALAMVVVAGLALWLGGIAWIVFVVLVSAGVFFEWSALVKGFAAPGAARLVWSLAGAVYCALPAVFLVSLRLSDAGVVPVLFLVAAVAACDIGAYFSGRAIGGPKIAPKISPSKTWAGLGGGVLGAALVSAAMLVEARSEPACVGGEGFCSSDASLALHALLGGALIAVVAQAGDFFESWMKRRAGVKDSGKLLPGHGGLFDRTDGLIAVSFVFGALFVLARAMGPA